MEVTFLRTEEWMAFGLCRTVDPDLWFAEKGDYATTQRAKKFCRECVVSRRCLEFAVANNEQHGVWGGLSTEERKQLRRGWREVAS